MSTVRLDRFASEIPTGNLLAGNPVQSEEWKAIARLQNWIQAGRVHVLVPPSIIGATVVAASTETFKFYVSRNFEHITRIWAVGLDSSNGSSASGSHGETGVFPGDPFAVFENQPSSKLLWSNRQLVPQSDSASELSYDVGCNTGSGSVLVRWIACYALPRTFMAPPSSSTVTSIASLEAGQPIGNRSGDLSIGTGVATNNDVMHEKIYRNHYHWSVDDLDTALIRTTTNTVTWDAFYTSLKTNCLGRLKFSGDTTYTLRWRVRGKGNGKVRITMASGATATINQNFGASFAWSSESTIAVDAEDVTAEDGRRATRWDDATVEFQSNSGTFEVAALSIYDRGGT